MLRVLSAATLSSSSRSLVEYLSQFGSLYCGAVRTYSVGHNGAGNSSIFRCLGGLWSIPCGTIRKPGGGDASEKGASNDAMFYIPQKPYQVVGTLIDQMTYPKTDAADELTKDRMREILAEVDLEYLLEREGALTDDIIWEDELSLSEKQRLAIARLIFNKPRYVTTQF